MSVRTLALIDSGADDCLFPGSLAGLLGITIPNQNSYVFCGTAANSQLAFFENINVGILDWQTGRVILTFDVYAGFCDTLEHTGMGLLGQNGFFSLYKITINHRGGYLEID
jgi:hypothetical protein